MKKECARCCARFMKDFVFSSPELVGTNSFVENSGFMVILSSLVCISELIYGA
jgi:hypothetical protein